MIKIKELWKRIPRIPIPLFGTKKLRLAFEFGVIMSEGAKEMKIELTPEIVIRAEEILLDQAKTKSAQEFANQMNGCLLAAFEPKEVVQ